MAENFNKALKEREAAYNSKVDEIDKLEEELSAETGRASRLHKRCNMRDEEIELLKKADRDHLCARRGLEERFRAQHKENKRLQGVIDQQTIAHMGGR